MKHLYTLTDTPGWVIPMTVTPWVLLITGLTAYAVVIYIRKKNKSILKKVNLTDFQLHFNVIQIMIMCLQAIANMTKNFLTTMQRDDAGVPQADMTYYDEIEGAAGKVGCVTMKDNPSYNVPEV